MRISPRAARRPRSTRRKSFWLAVAAVATVAVGATVAAALWDLPAPEDLFSRRVVQSTKIYDRTGGVLLYEIHGEERRTVVPFAEIPAAMKNATVAVEDANFYKHLGIDLRGIVRALVTDITAWNLQQGGSTITQQLVKNSLVGGERTIRRKIREAALSMILEVRLPKDEILGLYLNQIPYGSNAYGVEAAAQTFFGKHVRELSVGESALLAALPRAPSYYSPYGQHKDELMKRRDYTLKRMQELGYLSADEAARATQEVLHFLPATKNIRAPHFVMFVRDYLIERYGEEEVEQGGLLVTTTLNWKLQEQAEKIVSDSAARNNALIKAQNMALVALDPKSGEILSMVGSRDYFDVEHDGNFNVATALRQPGSAFKPFVYATAFRKGFTPETVLFDVPTEFTPGCTPEGFPRPGSGVKLEDCYHPQDYDETFRGPVTVRQALAQSLNMPSVKLLYLAGVEDSIQTAEELGITSLKDRSRFGLSLVLGGAEVKLLEMTSAFSAFANDGVLNNPVAVLKVDTADGRTLEEKHDSPHLVIDPEIARTLNDILSDNAARVPVFAPRSSLYFPSRQVAVKTGTTQEFRDAWTIGYTPSIAVGVWAGNNDNTAMQQKGSGVLAAGPSWHQFMDVALAETPPEEFPAPAPRETTKPVLKGIWQGDTVVTIDTVSGKRATEFTPPETRKDVAFGEPHDPLYWIDRQDPTGPPPQDPERDPQYPNWDAAFRAWLAKSGFHAQPSATAPGGYDDVHTPEKAPKVSLEKKSGPAGSIIIHVAVASSFGLREATLLSPDEQVLATRNQPAPPFEFTVPAEELAALAGSEVEVRVYDRVGNVGTATLPLP